jgi:glycosyltransferase involved in cell wall biosynthesis
MKRLCFRFTYALRWVLRENGQSRETLGSSVVISILLPVFQTPGRYIKEAVKSIVQQSYPFWELCIVDDGSGQPHLLKLLNDLGTKDTRVKINYREANRGISAATNDALALASGEFAVLLDHDDILPKNALLEIARTLEEYPDVDFVYTDEDKTGSMGFHHSPYYKPGWSPDLLLSRMYTCHLGVYRTSVLRALGGFRSDFDGSQDYDMVLRLTEIANGIRHIPKTLYHWRAIKGSTAKTVSAKQYASDAAYRAIQQALDRRGEGGKVLALDRYAGYFRVQYPVKEGMLVSIIILSKDNAGSLEKCLSSVFEKTSVRSFEVIVVDNGSKGSDTDIVLEKWSKREHERFRAHRLNLPFNFSSLCNRGAATARGDVLLFLNDDTEVITPEWLEWMAGFTCRDSIGAVGAMLLYPDNTIQHAGIVLGVKGIANHHHQGFSADSPGNNIGQLLSQTNYSAVTGACLMVKRRDFELVGRFEEELAVAFNDVDLCLKLLKRGKFNVFLPEARLYHRQSNSRGEDVSGERSERLQRESDWMMAKWGDLIRNDPFYNPNLSRDRLDCTPDLKLRKK